MANWESYHISDIISEIDNKKYVLPVIQRRLVWEEDKMELLFDTLLKGDLIPTDETIWTEDKFEEFIEARASLILAQIAKYT